MRGRSKKNPKKPSRVLPKAAPKTTIAAFVSVLPSEDSADGNCRDDCQRRGDPSYFIEFPLPLSAHTVVVSFSHKDVFKTTSSSCFYNIPGAGTSFPSW